MKFTFILFFYFSLVTVVEAKELSQPIGFYSKGRLANAARLPSKGKGFVKIFIGRDRAWGTHTLVEMLKKTGQKMAKQFPKAKDRLQVGDLSGKNGGPISRHGSHENGLDVDLAYYRTDGYEQDPKYGDGFTSVLVKNNKLSKKFDLKRNWAVIKHMHASGKVQRIFMHPEIKKQLCLHAKATKDLKKNSKVLKSIRPMDNHADHMHVRLYCPENARSCQSQDEVPAELGC